VSDLPALYDGNTGEVMPIPPNLSATSLDLPDGLELEQWVGYGRALERMGRAVQWWLGDWWTYGENGYGKRARAIVEAELPWAFQTCADAGWVAGKFAETSRRREVLSWSHHREVAALDPSIADELLDAAEEHNWTREQLRSAVRQRNRPQPGDAPPLSDQGPFDVLYVDPPWRYDYAPTDSRAIENQYPTMELDDICALNPPAADDVVLFLWATSPKLAESMAVLDAWKFEYRTCMVWVKDRIGMGYYARQQHELLLIAKRGEPPVPEPSARPSSVVTADRADHSVKPDVFYDLIEQMYPGRRYGEMFARRPRKGWGSWGNQS
jgi:N6-adenosine-specific RNA methylase IME4